MSKNIKSTDERKPNIVQAMKSKAGATKITLVKENKDGTFTGRALTPSTTSQVTSKTRFAILGEVTVTAQEAKSGKAKFVGCPGVKS